MIRALRPCYAPRVRTDVPGLYTLWLRLGWLTQAKVHLIIHATRIQVYYMQLYSRFAYSMAHRSSDHTHPTLHDGLHLHLSRTM